eukprot:3013623-Pyramimonas_sp.AAC.1
MADGTKQRTRRALQRMTHYLAKTRMRSRCQKFAPVVSRNTARTRSSRLRTLPGLRQHQLEGHGKPCQVRQAPFIFTAGLDIASLNSYNNNARGRQPCGETPTMPSARNYQSQQAEEYDVGTCIVISDFNLQRAGGIAWTGEVLTTALRWRWGFSRFSRTSSDATAAIAMASVRGPGNVKHIEVCQICGRHLGNLCLPRHLVRMQFMRRGS